MGSLASDLANTLALQPQNAQVPWGKNAWCVTALTFTPDGQVAEGFDLSKAYIVSSSSPDP